jgi:hypothetical protein
MDRRRLLKGGVAAGGAAAAAATQEGCAHGPGVGEAPLSDPATVDQIARNLDRRMAWIEDQAGFPAEMGIQARPARNLEEQARFDQQGRLFRQSLRTLYLTGRFMDLPDDIKVHPDIQARVVAAQPEMDEAVLGTIAMLEALGPNDHRAIQDTLRRHPDIGERLAQVLDQTGKEDGIPFQRRMSLRASTLELGRRMTAQSPALTIDPYVKKVRRIQARPHRDDETARVMAVRMGERAFWEHQRRLSELHGRWQRQLAQAPAGSKPPAAPAGKPAPAVPSRGQGVVSTGGKMMGFGALSIGVGLLFAGLYQLGWEFAAIPALVLGVTVGPIAIVIGLIVVIVGAIMVAAE